MLKVLTHTFVVFLLTHLLLPGVFGQPVLPSDLKKPKKYENKLLGAEKSAEKKFRGPRKFIQNTVTHYNWYFNANNKLNGVIERAKLAHRDDFSQLLSFYNFSLEGTSRDKSELDSVIYKTNTGILTHDLRNTWIDNLYMLMGKAYYFRNDPDSAYLTFQYINYAFSPKEPDGYDMPIGSNANEGTNVLSVSTKEKNNVVRRAFSTPPNRNESFIWQIKTYLAKDETAKAASLIQTIKNDPIFPERLQTDLNEVQALWFYKQKIYDSAAVYLEQALGNATSRQETSRWEFLIAQLYELAGNREQATAFYERAKKHTLDPVLEVYAILNAIKQNSTDSAAIAKSIKTLRKMGRQDSYSNYRDIIYYTAALIELERNNSSGAKEMLLRSTAASVDNLNPAQRTKSFLLLADLSFSEKNYPDAKRFYDSVNNNDPGIKDPVAFDRKKEVLHLIVQQMDIIFRQDSLQRIAEMPEAEREKLLKKMARQLRKKYGFKDEEELSGNAATGMNNSNKAAPDLFAANDKGDWYFNNPSLKSKGFTAFRQEWGNRPNVDNWRRQSSITKANIAAKNKDGGQLSGTDTALTSAQEISYEGLLKNIPLTREQMELSEDSIENAMLDLGILYIDNLEEYPVAIDTLEQFTDRYVYSSRMPEALYYLYYAWKQMGNEDKAAELNSQLEKRYAGTKYQLKVHDAATGEDLRVKKEATREYENIYNLFIEGNFEEALARKKASDSIHGSGYWTPQLLYIEAVYHIQARNDEAAKKILQDIIKLYRDDPMSEKAKNIIEVLGRRKEIEDYLTKLEIKRIEDTVFIANAPARPQEQIGTPMEQDSTTLQPIKPRAVDTVKTEKPAVNAPAIITIEDSARAAPAAYYTFNVEAPHAVVIVLTKVDPVYVTESGNAFNRYNKEKYYNRSITINKLSLNDTLQLVVMTGFENAAVALEYMQQTQPVAASRIVPWLPAPKYSLLIISEQNIEVLKNRQDIEEYRNFEQQYLPGK